MSAKRRKGKAKRRGYSKKKRSGHKKANVKAATTIGALVSAYKFAFETNPAGSSVAHAANIAIHAPTTANIMNGVRIVKGTNILAVATPVIGGIMISWAAKKTGANKYIHKIPLMKRVDA